MVLQEQDKKGQRDNMFRLEAIAETQAEISFKAGVGEVVAWIKANNHEPISLGVVSKEWQRKLKEWGINL